MKRAIFKLGKSIAIRSTYKKGRAQESFSVPIDVDEWLTRKDEKDWDFKIFSADALPEPGVQIAVSELNADTKASFGDPGFEKHLRRMLSRDYTLHLHHGLHLALNKKPVIGWPIELRESEQFEPIRLSYEDEAGVHVEILAGMASPPPETNDADDAENDDPYGWYVACNGRIVLGADKTSVSGWGTDGWQVWHGQYNGFIGMVFFTSADAEALPLTTTKRSVDTLSGVYRRAQSRMRAAAQQWIKYTNARKQALEEAKVAEAKAQPASIYSLKNQSVLKVPTLTAVPKERVANIHYSVPLARARTLGEALGNRMMHYRDIGKQSFEYTYKRLVGSK